MTPLANNVIMKLRLIIIAAVCALLASCTTTKRAPDPTPLSTISASAALVAVWRSNFSEGIGASGSRFLNLIPIQADDRIIGSTADGSVSAIDRFNGSKHWSTKLDGEITAGVGEDAGVVAVVSGSGKLIALDSNSGYIRWERPIDQTVFTPPLVYRGFIVLQTIDGDLIATDAKSGEPVWDAFYDQPEFVVFGSPRPLGIGNLVLVGNATGRVLATDLATGFEAWQIYLAAERSQTALSEAETIPVVYGDKLFISDYTQAIVAYDLQDGNLFWEHRRNSKRRLAVDSTQVYGADLDDRVFALSRGDGSVQWEQSSLLYRKIRNIALVGEYLVLGDGSDILHILDTGTGEIVGRKKLKGDVVFGGLLVDGNNLYVSYRSGQIDAFRLVPIN